MTLLVLFSFILSSDLEEEEQLMVTGPAVVQEILPDQNIGQGEHVVSLGAPLDIMINSQTPEQTEEPPESVPDPALTMAQPKVDKDTNPGPSPALAPATAPAPATAEAQAPAPATVEAPSPARVTVEAPLPTSAIIEAPAPAPATLEAPSPATAEAPAPAPATLEAPAPTPAPARVEAPSPAPGAAPVQDSGPSPSTLPDPSEEIPLASPEPLCTSLPSQSDPAPKAKATKSKPPSLKIKPSLNESALEDQDQEVQVPNASYNFDPNQVDDSFNPFTCGGSKIQNSPPPCGTNSLPRLEPIGGSLPPREASSAPQTQAEVTELSSEAKPVKLEFGLNEGEVSKPPPRRLGGKKTLSKLPGKKQRPKSSATAPKPAPEPIVFEPVSEPISDSVSEPVAETTFAPVLESTAPLNLDDVPIPKSGYNFDPSQWEDPNFNPFGSNSTVSSSPGLPKGSYNFDQHNFDDSVDPFKPTKALSDEGPSNATPMPEMKVKDGGKEKAERPQEEKKIRQIPKKTKDRTIT